MILCGCVCFCLQSGDVCSTNTVCLCSMATVIITLKVRLIVYPANTSDALSKWMILEFGSFFRMLFRAATIAFIFRICSL